MDIIRGLERVSKRDQHLIEDTKAPRRGSVAVIVRFPKLSLQAKSISKVIAELKTQKQSFIDDAEIMFIKRAANERDRWSSHIAVPGGRRDPQDDSDLATAVRETFEEVGLSLTNDAVYAGQLDQQLVKVSFYSKPIMTLCPFVFVMTNPNAEANLQASEVATAFWHPIRELFDPKNVSREKVPLGDRMSPQWMPTWLSSLIQCSTGKLLFGSITLNPRTLLHTCNESRIDQPPYKLWGLTLAFLTDFFELIEPHRATRMIRMPTLQAWDIRFIIHIMSKRYMSRSIKAINGVNAKGQYLAGEMDYVSKLLTDYFWYLKKGVLVALVLRLVVGSALAYKIVRTFLQTRSRRGL